MEQAEPVQGQRPKKEGESEERRQRGGDASRQRGEDDTDRQRQDNAPQMTFVS